MMKRSRKNSKIIREAIDSYPGGLCFATGMGRVILANHRINELALELVGHTVLNALSCWEDLLESPQLLDMNALHHLWHLTKMGASEQDAEAQSDETPQRKELYFRLNDRSVWRFEQQMIDENTIQIEANDLSELYSLCEELYEQSESLRRMHERQRALLDNIVEYNHSKEVLSAKMRIHDQLGYCVLSTNRALEQGDFGASGEGLQKKWTDVIDNLLIIPDDSTQDETSGLDELQEVAALIGCTIECTGTLPVQKKTARLLFAAIREALSNAVRHASATKLLVKISYERSFCRLLISDNGEAAPAKVQEGSGLGGLRNLLEQEGATMTINCDNHVTLQLTLPYSN